MGIYLIKFIYHFSAFWKGFLYKLLFGKRFSLGKGTTFRRYFQIYLDPQATIRIGRNCFFNHGCSINALQRIEIGDDCLFGENVKIYDHNHRFSRGDIPIKEQGFSADGVTIGNQCWIGSNVVILRGVHIGARCVIGAGAVVDRDIPEGMLVTADRSLTMKPILWK